MAQAATTDVIVPYEPNAKQSIFHACPATEAVYGGAKGGGKSCALVMEALAYGLEYPGAEEYLFRETYDDLESNLIKEWKDKVPPELYKYNESKHIATLYNGTRVFFRYIKNKADAERYNGRSIDFIGVDELTRHAEVSIQILLSCMRSPKGFPPRFRGTCNPGSIGHVWVKGRYITPTSKGQKSYRDPDTGNLIAFIPAKVYDNTVLMKNDPAYVRRLENLPEARKRAFLEGDWDAYEGQAFEEFRTDIHVCRPFQIPTHWRRWMGNDPGYTDPFAWYWFAVDPDGIVYIYREYTREYGDPKIVYSDQAKKVIQLSTYSDFSNTETKERISFKVTGHDAWNTHPLAEEGKTIINHYEMGGLHGFIQAITDRKLRKATWHEYLKPFEGPNGKLTAKVKIFSTCKKLIETLPQQVEDEDNPEKVAETDYDHWYDGAGYGLIAWHAKKSRIPDPEKGEVQRDKEKLAKARAGSGTRTRRRVV
ncbi:MAG: phage terminase large subunit [Desulfuromonadaceae bacterium]